MVCRSYHGGGVQGAVHFESLGAAEPVLEDKAEAHRGVAKFLRACIERRKALGCSPRPSTVNTDVALHAGPPMSPLASRMSVGSDALMSPELSPVIPTKSRQQRLE